MSVDLRCPGCEMVIGNASHEDSYKERYHFFGEDGQPICPTCDKGTDVKGYKIVVAIAVVILIGLALINIFS